MKPPGRIIMAVEPLRLGLLERLGRLLERSEAAALGPEEVNELRRILVRRHAYALKFDVRRLLVFGRTVFEVQCTIRIRAGLPLPRCGPRALLDRAEVAATSARVSVL